MVFLQRTGLELQDLRAMFERMHRLPELFAAKTFASHTAIKPGTFFGHGASRRGFCTNGQAPPLLTIVASTSACTRSEPLQSPPPPPHAAHAADKSEMMFIGIPRDSRVVAMII